MTGAAAKALVAHKTLSLRASSSLLFRLFLSFPLLTSFSLLLAQSQEARTDLGCGLSVLFPGKAASYTEGEVIVYYLSDGCCEEDHYMDVRVEPKFFASHDLLKKYKLLPDAQKEAVAKEFLGSRMQEIIERDNELTFTLQSATDLQIGPYFGRKFIYEVMDTAGEPPPAEVCILLLLADDCDALVQLAAFRLKTTLRKVDHDPIELEKSIKAFPSSLTYNKPNIH